MSEPIITLVVDIPNIEVLASVDGLSNVATKIPYDWIATPEVGGNLKWPGVVELGPPDPDHFIDLTTLSEEDRQETLGGWVLEELGRANVRNVKANMTAILNARATETVKIFAPPPPEPPAPEEPPPEEPEE